MNVLHITNNYPTTNYPISGIFVKEQIDSLQEFGVKSEVFLINGREKGKFEYIKSIFRLRRKLSRSDYDLIHCHHALSGVTLFLSGYNKKM